MISVSNGGVLWIDQLSEEVAYFEQRILEIFEATVEVELIDTLPGIGFILTMTIWLDGGDGRRFASHEKLAAYAGTTSRLHQSGSAGREPVSQVGLRRGG